MKYDYLIVGSGLFGATFAYKAKEAGKKCLVIEKREHIGGNIYCKNINGINVHLYGAHIFHTSDEEVWDFVNLFVEFNNFINSPLANYKGKLYNLPFNMNTFYQIWGVVTPNQAKQKIEESKSKYNLENPKNLEEQAISLVGEDIYNTLIKGYTEKQWGKFATELPAFIIKRLPLRFTFNNNYFNDKYQGIPIGGYNNLIKKLLDGIEVKLECDYFDNVNYFKNIAGKIIYTGTIDRFYNYKFGDLEYRSLKFENKEFEIANYQGNAVINYTEKSVPYTRIIEHKHFEFGTQNNTIITKEYSENYIKNVNEPYYPINDVKNNKKYLKYKYLADKEKNVIFGGRLAEYKYYDMHNIVRKAIDLSKTELQK